jgi:hypothetical protein
MVAGSVATVHELQKASVYLPQGVISSSLRVEIGAHPGVVQTNNFSIVTIAEPDDVRAFIMRQVL